MQKDGLVLMYMKDSVVYPIAMTQDEFDRLQMLGAMFNPIKVLFNHPQFTAKNLLEDKNK